MYEISVAGRFTARHQLRLPDGTLEPLHEHVWHVKAAVAGPQLDEAGLLLDFQSFKPKLDALLAGLFDRNLNRLEAFAGQNPSAENVAAYIAAQLDHDLPDTVHLCRVEVEETPGCVACYRPEPPSSPAF